MNRDFKFILFMLVCFIIGMSILVIDKMGVTWGGDWDAYHHCMKLQQVGKAHDCVRPEGEPTTDANDIILIEEPPDKDLCPSVTRQHGLIFVDICAMVERIESLEQRVEILEQRLK